MVISYRSEKFFVRKIKWGALSVPPIQQRPQPLGYLPLLVARITPKTPLFVNPAANIFDPIKIKGSNMLGFILRWRGAEFQELFFIYDRNFHFFGFRQFAPRLFARDDEVSLFTDRAADPPAAVLNESLCVITLHRRQSPGQNKGLALEYARRLAPPGVRRLHLHSRFGETFDQLPIS